MDLLKFTVDFPVVADFSDGFCQNSAILLFTFVSVLLSTYSCDLVSKFDLCHKLVLARIDAKPVTNLRTALALMTSLFAKLEAGSVSDAVSRNLKFQVDQLLPSLLSVFVDISKSTTSGSASKLASSKQSSKTTAAKTDLDREAVASCLECLQLLHTIAEVNLEGWTKTVASGVKSSKMTMAFKTISDQTRELGDRARLTVEMVTLSSALAQVDSGWRSVETELVNDQERVKLVIDLVKMDNVEGRTLKHALSILNEIEIPLDMLDTDEGKTKEPLMKAEEAELSVDAMADIDNMLESVGAAVGRLELEDVVADVLQLAEVRRGEERRQVAHLTAALAAADQQVTSGQNNN